MGEQRIVGIQHVTEVHGIAVHHSGNTPAQLDHVHVAVRFTGQDGVVHGILHAGIGQVLEFVGHAVGVLDILHVVEAHEVGFLTGGGFIVFPGFVVGVIVDVPPQTDGDIPGIFRQRCYSHGKHHDQRQQYRCQFFHKSISPFQKSGHHLIAWPTATA